MKDLALYIKRSYQKPENGLMKVIITFFLAFGALLALKVGTLIAKQGDVTIYRYIVSNMRLNSDWHVLLQRPWTIFTYVFAQNVGVLSFFNLLLQMIAVYILGIQFVDFFNSRRFLRLYMSSIIFSGLTVLLVSHFFPYIKQGRDIEGPSAAIYALVAAVATIMPKLPVAVFRTQYIAIFCVLGSLWDISESHYTTRGIAKLAGMLWGYLYVSAFRISSYRSKSSGKRAKHHQHGKGQSQVEYLLDKIASQGYNNLTEQEKKDLFDAGK